jgi:hypothetical protein
MSRAAVVLVLLCAPIAVHAQPAAPATTGIDGNWHGQLGTNPGLRLVLSLTRAADGSQRGLLDSVDQGSRLPIDSISTSNDRLRFEINSIGGVYEGKLDRDGKRLRGTWTQRGVPAQPLDFERGELPAGQAAARPAKPGPFGPQLEVWVGKAPTSAVLRGERVLVYELQVTNFGGGELALLAIDVLDAGGARVARVEGDELSERLHRLGRPDDRGEPQRALAPGTRSTVFMWVPLKGATPKRLQHRLEVREVDGVMRPLLGAPTEVADGKLRLGPPLRGDGWLAGNGPSAASGHRRAQLGVDGHLYISQRFAIDWVRVDAEGKTFSGDQKANASYRAYGAEALAVAPGTVVEVKDGIPENIPGDRAVAIDLETVAGNHVLLDLGGGRRALYAHFQPGSLRVKKGDKVKRGQVLGLVGNSGNSTQPHLHFHVAEGATPLGAEGVPYLLEAFDAKKGVKEADKQHRVRELPMENEIVDFGK